ncbi:outer membrane protein assembly factor BamD (BamD/ComL family) [Haloferula luteola]|uniref:Outer membrane protein assembly factor BamD (BamD/ComL family) n=1 Tax=Haloferula luteola TaxID=595692 RepID=A0A840V9Y1_9BACT|nr:tetratricopeptide repeat protein [Haloferula luteola]MBB5350589.1 outer membrane protein assembly factor BamD (BamD/ComL family) [Haloferula luteola]
MRLSFALLPLVALFASCGNDADLPPMISASSGNNQRADALFAQAQAAEQAGKTKKAIKLYDEIADKIALSDKAPEARFRQAKLLDESGETLDAFDAYQELIVRYQGSGLYRQAFQRQTEMAFSAADGGIKSSFLGLKSKLAANKVIEMLKKVASNAPRSTTASKASFKIAELLAGDDKIDEAVSAYRHVVVEYPSYAEAPEAQFRIGEVLLSEARDGNQDQANLDRAEDALRDYLSQFPGHRRNAEARKLLSSIGGRDLQNTFDIASFYEKKGDAASAKFYYQEVIRRSKSGALHDKAQARLSALGGQ